MVGLGAPCATEMQQISMMQSAVITCHHRWGTNLFPPSTTFPGCTEPVFSGQELAANWDWPGLDLLEVGHVQRHRKLIEATSSVKKG